MREPVGALVQLAVPQVLRLERQRDRAGVALCRFLEHLVDAPRLADGRSGVERQDLPARRGGEQRQPGEALLWRGDDAGKESAIAGEKGVDRRLFKEVEA